MILGNVSKAKESQVQRAQGSRAYSMSGEEEGGTGTRPEQVRGTYRESLKSNGLEACV